LSGLKGQGLGAAYKINKINTFSVYAIATKTNFHTLKGEIFLCKGINDDMYRSRGIIKLWVSSKKCRRNSADCTSSGRLFCIPLISFFTIDLSLYK